MGISQSETLRVSLSLSRPCPHIIIIILWSTFSGTSRYTLLTLKGALFALAPQKSIDSRFSPPSACPSVLGTLIQATFYIIRERNHFESGAELALTSDKFSNLISPERAEKILTCAGRLYRAVERILTCNARVRKRGRSQRRRACEYYTRARACVCVLLLLRATCKLNHV